MEQTKKRTRKTPLEQTLDASDREARTKVITIKPKRSRNRLRSPYEFSLEAVTRAADTLVTFGFSEAQAYRTIAAQLHESLVKLKGGK